MEKAAESTEPEYFGYSGCHRILKEYDGVEIPEGTIIRAFTMLSRKNDMFSVRMPDGRMRKFRREELGL